MADTDVQLLARFALSGEAEGFRQLVRRHAAMVFGVARRVSGEHAVAEEVAQECFRELAAQGSAVGTAIAAWLHATATAHAEHFNRSRGVRRLEDSGSPEATWDDISPHLDAAIAALPEDHRQALVLYLLEGRERVEVAAEIGVDTTEMSSRVHAGVAAVQASLKSSGVTGSTTTLPMLLSRHVHDAVPPALMSSLARLATAPKAAPAPGPSAATPNIVAPSRAAPPTAHASLTAHTPPAGAAARHIPTPTTHHPQAPAPHPPATPTPRVNPIGAAGSGAAHPPAHVPPARSAQQPPGPAEDEEIGLAAAADTPDDTPFDFEDDPPEKTTPKLASSAAVAPGAPGARVAPGVPAAPVAPGDYIPAPPIDVDADADADADAAPSKLKLYVAVGVGVLVVAVAALLLVRRATSSGPPPEVVMSSPAYQGVIHVNYWAAGQTDGPPTTIDLDTVPGTSATRQPDGSLDFETVRQGTRWTYSPSKAQIILDDLPAESAAAAARLVDAVSPDTYVAARQKALTDPKAKVETHQSKDGDLDEYNLSLPPAPGFDHWQKATFWVDPTDKRVRKIQATLDSGGVERMEYSYGGVAVHDIYDLAGPDAQAALREIKVTDTLAAEAKPAAPGAGGPGVVIQPVSKSGYGTWVLLGTGGGVVLLVIALLLRRLRPYNPPDVPLGRHHHGSAEDTPADQSADETPAE